MKRIVLVVVTVLVLLFVLQNIQMAELRFLIWRIAMPQALLIIFIFACGILTGWLLRAFSADARGDGQGG